MSNFVLVLIAIGVLRAWGYSSQPTALYLAFMLAAFVDMARIAMWLWSKVPRI
jgi:hypothetical protein